MDTEKNFNQPVGRHPLFRFWIVFLALVAGLLLSVLSWLEICVEHCSANEDYRLLGFPFAIVGLAFFTTAIALHFLSRVYPICAQWLSWLISIALGAEIMFIVVQKYQIGHWCPLCLSIAFALAVAGLVNTIDYVLTFFLIIQKGDRGEIMSKVKRGLTSLSFIMLGFLMAFIGISKPDQAEAAANDIKTRLAFGNPKSQIEVYFVTDWFCPACKKLEPEMEELVQKINSQTAFYFVDFPVHKKSLNFSPYNLAFLINDKSQYFVARQLLSQIAEKTDSPIDADVFKAAKQAHIPFKDLSFLDIKAGLDFFESVSNDYDLSETPTIVVVNTKTKKNVKMQGLDEITQAKVLKAIKDLSDKK